MRRRAATVFVVALAAMLAAAPAGEAAELQRAAVLRDGDAVVRLPGIAGGIAMPAAAVGVLSRDGTVRRVILNDGKLALASSPEARTAAGVRPPDILSDGEVTHGTRDIVRAWLTDPTDRYRHAVLGDAVEAGGLALEGMNGRVARYRLDQGSVFEDRRVRLSDLDGDGRDEAIVVQSYLDAGAALAVFGLGDTGVIFQAEVPAIGRANRWLNPAGAADFDGDGHLEIAFVETSHIGGTLRLYEYRDRKLHEDHAARGFSNHAIGSREQDMAAVHDWTGDGTADIAIPGADRETLRLVTLAGGVFTEIESVRHDRQIVTAVRPAILDSTGAVYAVYGLADGTLVAGRPAGSR
jgi:hypothetical protein